MLSVAGDAVSEKPGAAPTVRLIDAVACRLPEVPVTVTVEVPNAAELLAVKVSVLLVVAEAGLNDAVTPAGRPVAARLTPLVKPFCGVTVMVLVPVFPGTTVTLEGFAERVNEGGPVTVTVRRAVLVSDPEVPVMVTVEVPEAAEALAVRVSRLLVVAEAGLNDAVTPAGRPEAARLTPLVKPFCGVTVMVLVPLPPGAMDTLEADKERLKLGTFAAPVRSLISDWPVGVPQPVARSYPLSAGNPLLPVAMSCRSLE